MTASPSLLVAVLRARAQLALHPRVSAGRRPKFFGPRPLIGSAGRIEIGDGFYARAGQFPVQFGAGPEGVLRIGDAVFFNQGVNVFAARSVTIGSNVRLADLAAVYDTDFHEVEQGAPVRVAAVTLEDNVWIGRAAIVLPGVTVGEGAVVAAGAVVTSDVPPRTVVAGNPARVVREIRAPDGWIRE
jgi:acetyltransferase-like isoleucine patch superfamily enzyme